jgi:hypothetical protein
MAAVLGVRGTGSWAADQRPKNWREMILRFYPNGRAPLTAMLAMLKSERTTDPEFNWWTKSLPTQGGAVTNVYTDSGMVTAYVSGGAAGDTLYVKVAEAVAKEHRAGHQVLLRDSSNLDVDVNAKVTDVTLNGANSRLTVRLLEADDNSATNDLSDCDRVLIIGNINPENGVMPDVVSYDPTKWYNYTQIFRTSLAISRTARLTKLRTGDAYQELKREAMELHSIEMEKAYLWGVRTENTGANGLPERTTGGLIPAAKASGVTSHYVTDETYDATTWLNGGENWLDEHLEEVFRYGSTEKLAFCGSGAMLGLKRLAANSGTINIEPGASVYGLDLLRWVTPFGSIYIKTHPLFSYETTNRYAMLIFEPALLKERYITQTTFFKEGEQQNTGSGRIDGISEEWLTEIGLEYHHPSAFAWLSGFNQDNPA